MHHALRFYSTNQELVIRFYMSGAKITKLPVIGRYIRGLLNKYAVTQHIAYILTPEETKKIIDTSTNIAVGDCKCRKVFKNCDGPIKTDIVIGVGYDVFTEVRKEEYVKISKDEAKKIIDDCKRYGLVQSIIKCKEEFYVICNCCPCCCVPLRLRKEYRIKNAWTKDTNMVNKLLECYR